LDLDLKRYMDSVKPKVEEQEEQTHAGLEPILVKVKIIKNRKKNKKLIIFFFFFFFIFSPLIINTNNYNYNNSYKTL